MSAVDRQIAAIVAAAPPLTAEQSATIATLGKAIADLRDHREPARLPHRNAGRTRKSAA